VVLVVQHATVQIKAPERSLCNLSRGGPNRRGFVISCATAGVLMAKVRSDVLLPYDEGMGRDLQGMLDGLEDGSLVPLDLARELLESSLQEGNFSKSLASCHTPGLDSVVLYDSPEGMIRFYLAWHGQHHMDELHDEEGNFTVGIHNHRYQIAKVPLSGLINNVRTCVSESPTDYKLCEYVFSSRLKGEKMQAAFARECYMEPLRLDPLTPGMVVVMPAEALHTVQVPQSSVSPFTSWMVIEGPPCSIEPLIYSPRRDLTLSDDDLYQAMDEEAARERVETILSLM